MTNETADQRPVLRVVRGDATAEEIAAITALLAAAGGGGAQEEAPAGMSLWRQQGRLRHMPAPGPSSWRASALPT